MAIRTGQKGWANLEEFDTFTGAVTGNTKPNIPSDPDYVPPVYDPVTCSPQGEFYLNNVDTDHSDPFRLFVDVDLAMAVNGAPVVYLTDVESAQYTINNGDTVLIRQLSNPSSNPWPPDSTATLEIKDQDGNTVYSNSETVQALELASYTWNPTPGLYTVKSLGVSVATGYRKYVCTSTVDSGIPFGDFSMTIYDETTSDLVSITAQLTGTSEFNVVDDSGTCDLQFSNTGAFSIDVSVSWTGGSDSFTIPASGSHGLPGTPKSNYTVTVTIT